MDTKKRYCIWDVESSLMESLHFEVWETNIAKENVVVPSYIHCISLRFYGEKKIQTISQTDFPLFKYDIHDDTEVLKAFSKIIQQPNIVLVAHNGDNFDIRKFNARLLSKGLPPIPPIKTIDTLKIARRYFKLEWNSLDHLARILGYEGKMENPKGLWRDCFFGDKKAMRHMGKYNRQDIEALTHVFERLMPYVKNTAGANAQCQNPTCGSVDIQWRGPRPEKGYHEFKCNICHSWGQIKIPKLRKGRA